MKANIILIVILSLVTAHGQRISSGAHDWYLRFRSERDLDRAETVPCGVRDFLVKNCCDKYNKNHIQSGKCHSRIPKTAMISDIQIDNYEVMINGNHSSVAEDPERQTLQIPRAGKSLGSDWWSDEKLFDYYESNDADIEETHEISDFTHAHVHLHSHEHQDIDLEEGNDFNLFALPIIIGPRQNISIYEDFLFADNESWVEAKMFLSPGEIVKSFSVEIFIDDENILEAVATASVLGDITNETLVVDQVQGNMVNFTMNTLEQAHYFGSSGFYGTVSVRFNTNDTSFEDDISRNLSPENYLSANSELELKYVGTNEDDDFEKKIFSYDDLIFESWNMEHQH